MKKYCVKKSLPKSKQSLPPSGGLIKRILDVLYKCLVTCALHINLSLMPLAL